MKQVANFKLNRWKILNKFSIIRMNENCSRKCKSRQRRKQSRAKFNKWRIEIHNSSKLLGCYSMLCTQREREIVKKFNRIKILILFAGTSFRSESFWSAKLSSVAPASSQNFTQAITTTRYSLVAASQTSPLQLLGGSSQQLKMALNVNIKINRKTF